MHLTRRTIGSAAALLLAGATVVASAGVSRAAGTVPPPPTPGQLATAKATFEGMVGAPAEYVSGSVQAHSVAVHAAKDISNPKKGVLLPRLHADPPGDARSNAVAAVLYDPYATGLPAYDTVVSWSTTPPAGTEYETLPDGSVVVVGQDVDGDGDVWETSDVQAAFGVPKARDAAGQDLDTWYEIKNGQLLQHVHALGATYPVVVDPSITGVGWYGLGTPVIYVQFSLSETRRIYATGVGDSWSTAAAVGCGGIPHLLGKAACAYIVQDKLGDFKAAINLAHDRDDCLKARVPTVAFPFPAEAVRALDFYVKTC